MAGWPYRLNGHESEQTLGEVPCLVLGLRGKSSSLSTLSVMLDVDFSLMCFIRLRDFYLFFVFQLYLL